MNCYFLRSIIISFMQLDETILGYYYVLGYYESQDKKLFKPKKQLKK